MGARILVVEDTPHNLDLMVYLLEAHLTARLRGTTPVAVHEPGVPAAPAAGDGAVVLAVDDWPTNIALVQSVLEPNGYRVVGARSTGEALETARRVRPDLVLCDVHLTASTGMDLLARLRADPELAAIPFAFVTGTAERVDGLLPGGTPPVIRRPVEPERFLAAVEALLAAGRPA